MERKAGSVVVVVALVVLSGIAVSGTVGGARTAPLGGDAPSSATAVVAPQADDGNATNATDGTTAGTGTNSTGNATLGAQLSSFMSASAADAESEVESGMFVAKWNRSDRSQRSRLLHQRTTEIEERIEELRGEREALLAAEDLTPRERARAAWLAAQAHALTQSVDQMSEAADRANVNVDRTKLGELRRNASNLTDGEIDEMTANIVDHERGPPDDAGPPGDDEHGPPDDAGPPDGERGPQKNVDDGDTNRTGGSGNDVPPGKDDSGDDEKKNEKDEKDKGSGKDSGSGNEDDPGGSGTSGGKSNGGDTSGRNGGSGNDDPPGKDDGGNGNSDGSNGNGTSKGKGTSNGNGASNGNGNSPNGDSGSRN